MDFIGYKLIMKMSVEKPHLTWIGLKENYIYEIIF